MQWQDKLSNELSELSCVGAVGLVFLIWDSGYYSVADSYLQVELLKYLLVLKGDLSMGGPHKLQEGGGGGGGGAGMKPSPRRNGQIFAELCFGTYRCCTIPARYDVPLDYVIYTIYALYIINCACKHLSVIGPLSHFSAM